MGHHHVIAEATIDVGAQCPWSRTQMLVAGVAHRAVTTTDPRENDPLGSDRDTLRGGADGHDLPGDLVAERKR